jgi:hypothetical protein
MNYKNTVPLITGAAVAALTANCTHPDNVETNGRLTVAKWQSLLRTNSGAVDGMVSEPPEEPDLLQV